jgi:alcohol dehydrogenase (cytochrome c)
MNRTLRIAAAACLLAGASVATAQAFLDPSAIGKPATSDWSTYYGDYSGQRYSTLAQIDRRNVKGLALAWSYRANRATRDATSGGSVAEPVPVVLGPGALAGGLIKSTPLFHDGVLYFSAPDHAWAVDARTGLEIWHFFWRTAGGEYIGNRGMAMYRDWLYFGTPDGHLVSLNAKDGTERWHKQVGSVRDNYYVSSAPVVVGKHLIVGLSGDAMDVPAWVESRDLETGELQWKWNTTPAAGTPGSETWPDAKALQHGGGMTWQPVTYDPALNLIYLATGNPNPVYEPELRAGDNLYSCSLVAINPDTGKMAWYYQTSPNEAWDFDANQVPVLFDKVIAGKPRKLVAQATRNGMYFLLDRVTGEHLVSSRLAESVNWSSGFNAQGQPERIPEKLSQAGGTLISPSNGGVQNWAPPAYLPGKGLLYFNAMQGYDIHYRYAPADAKTGALGHFAQGVGGYDMSLRALDVATGKIAWVHRYAGSEWNPPRPHQVGGLLATAGKLLFSGAPAGGPGGFMVAYDPDNGRQLWHATLPALVSNSPITYVLDGRQYLVFAANDVLYAWRLP